MKIGLHEPAFGDRGTTLSIYDYATALRKYYGYEVCAISSRQKSILPERFAEFGYRLYDNASELENIVDEEKIDFLLLIKGGENDGVCPKNCKTGIHCVFHMKEPHGNVYAGVSEWLAAYSKMPLWVPPIVNIEKTAGTLHTELGIPSSAFVIGRHGGMGQFDIPFVHAAIQRALNTRADLWFVFLNTREFIQHPRVKFVPFNPSIQYRNKFINTCDAMLHARSDGETFGSAIGEFSASNKPVLTYDSPNWWYMRSHLHILGEKAITYKDEEQLLAYLIQIDKDYVKDVDWDCYSTRFSPENVIKQFNDVFIK